MPWSWAARCWTTPGLFDQVRQLAVTDPLTGLSNYRTLINVMESEIQRSRRTGRRFAVLLFDLDGLKTINDEHGHLVGSRAICRLASVLRIHCRAMDTAARYGGDEFAVVLPEAGEEAAASVSRRICERLAKDGEFPHVTVSVGAAVFPRDGETLDASVQRRGPRPLWNEAASGRHSYAGPHRGLSVKQIEGLCIRRGMRRPERGLC
jgi:diguanylate cyclase (GGDEF)-like protein